MSTLTPTKPSVSVVVPTYNAVDFIEQALARVFDQTLLPGEVVVVDDCSTDNTENVVLSIARGSRVPITFLRLDHNTGSPSRPLNTGIAKASGQLIVTLDQDDLLRPEKIELSLEALSSLNTSFAIGRFSIVGFEEGDMTPIWPTAQFSEISDYLQPDAKFSLLEQKPAFKALLNKNFTGTCSNFCFDKSLWRKVGGFNERIRTCSDLDFVLKVVMETPIAVIDRVLVDYRWQRNSLNHSNLRKTDLELNEVRLAAIDRKPAWAGDERADLEDSGVHAARLALKHGDWSGAASMLKLLLTSGSLSSVVKRRLASADSKQ
jgi:glycosyltransferase involved in cell wall biosynthesis